MEVVYNGRWYAFRPCDTRGMAQEEVQRMATNTGRMQYEPGHAWLVVPGIGYAWETNLHEIRAFVAGVMLGCGATERMTLQDAECCLNEWESEGVELPDGIDAETLTDVWNEFIDADCGHC